MTPRSPRDVRVTLGAAHVDLSEAEPSRGGLRVLADRLEVHGEYRDDDGGRSLGREPQVSRRTRTAATASSPPSPNPNQHKSKGHDIGLVTLTSKVEFSDKVGVICLPSAFPEGRREKGHHHHHQCQYCY